MTDDKKQNKISRPPAVSLQARPPVVVVMGHVDHGKSTLLDYIRKTNVVEKEAGGITQRISAYEVLHKPARPNGRSGGDEKGKDKKITFIDTPGHEAFYKMRERGAQIADIAILVVSAEDGVKTQTIEAWKVINESRVPCIVAINKIDKPGANIEKTKIELSEQEIYLENYGGKIPCAEISAKTGAGVDDLLSLILILAEVENLEGNPIENASGFVIETNLDSKRGTMATLIIKEGSLRRGMIVVVGDALSPTRIMEDFKGSIIDKASFSAPVRVFGFDKMPMIGGEFKAFTDKKEAAEYVAAWQEKNKSGKFGGGGTNQQNEIIKKNIPVILKVDTSGTLEAVEKEIDKINKKVETQNAEFRIVVKGVGPIGESDIKNIGDAEETIVIAFNVKADKNALDIAQKRALEIHSFDIIYKMAEWLEGEIEKRRPRVETVEIGGRAKIVRAFSRTKERQIVGGKVIEGTMLSGGNVKIMRRDFEIGKGKIVNLEKNKVKSKEVEVGSELGMMVESKIEIAPGDILELFSIAQK